MNSIDIIIIMKVTNLTNNRYIFYDTLRQFSKVLLWCLWARALLFLFCPLSVLLSLCDILVHFVFI